MPNHIFWALNLEEYVKTEHYCTSWCSTCCRSRKRCAPTSTIPTRSSRAGAACLACFQKHLFAIWMWKMYWISLHTLIDSRLCVWDASADHQPLREGSGSRPKHHRLTKVNFVHVYPQIPLLCSNIRLLVSNTILFSWKKWQNYFLAHP